MVKGKKGDLISMDMLGSTEMFKICLQGNNSNFGVALKKGTKKRIGEIHHCGFYMAYSIHKSG